MEAQQRKPSKHKRKIKDWSAALVILSALLFFDRCPNSVAKAVFHTEITCRRPETKPRQN